MRFNTAIQAERNKASAYFNELVDKQVMVEVVKVSPKRSLNQNAYLHLLIGAFANHFGYTNDEAKLIYKEVNHFIYYYRKKDRDFIRSSADLTKDEMRITIDNFREASAAQGCPLPLASDQDWLRQIENDLETNKYYVR